MSNYNNLKTTIDANIKQNGNQEITGPILNSVLNQMVNILGTGYQFAGVATLDPATDPGTPDAKVFYIANGKGTYTNFGSLEVTEDEVVVLYWDSTWHKVATGIASQAKLAELSEEISQVADIVEGMPQNYVSGQYLKKDNTIGNNDLYGVTDYIPYTQGKDVIWRFSNEYQPYYILFYKADKSFISGSEWSAQFSAEYNGRKITASDIASYARDAAYLRASFNLGFSDAEVLIDNISVWRPQVQIPSLPEQIDALSNEIIADKTTEHRFIYGSYNSSGTFGTFPAKISARIPLSYGQNNKINIIMPQNFTLFFMSMEDEAGVVRDISTAYEFIGNKSNTALWICLRKEDEKYIAEYEKDYCLVENTFQSSNLKMTEELESGVNILAENVDKNTQEVYLNSQSDKISENELKEQIAVLEESMSALYKAGAVKDSQVVTLPHANGGLFILNMHKRENDGFVAKNNAYLPNANNDFSDVGVFANGKALPMREVYCGNIDIIPDDRLKNVSKSLIHTDSKGVKYGSNSALDKVVKSSDTITWEEVSVFNGLEHPSICKIDSQDNIFVYSQGMLYKSAAPYTTKKVVLDVTQYHSDALILPECMIEHPTTHRLFVSTYQVDYDIHVLCSDNYGESWTTCYRSNKYQHVHNISFNPYSNPIAIYVGCDGGGGILKSTDNGETWVDLREQNQNIPQSTDNGAIYFDESGYRLFGGETSIVGGHSIIKSTNDVDFIPVLSCGKGVYYVLKQNGILFGGLISTSVFQTTGIIISEDNGVSWKTAMTTAPMLESGASDGYRYLSQVDNQIICGLQSSKMELSPLRIYSGGENYYAQYLVEVPQGVDTLIIESGHLAAKHRVITNSYGNSSNTDLYRLNFTDGLLNQVSGGRNIGEIIPSIQSARDKIAARLDVGYYHNLEHVDLSNKAFHVGFWYKTNDMLISENLIYSSLGILVAKHIDGRDYLKSGIFLERDYFLKIGSNRTPMISPGTWGGAWLRFDMNFTVDGKVVCYINGIKKIEETIVDNIIPYLTEGNILCLYVPQYSSENHKYKNQSVKGIQYFEITQGNITEEDAIRNFYANTYDVY